MQCREEEVEGRVDLEGRGEEEGRVEESRSPGSREGGSAGPGASCSFFRK